YYNGLDFTKTGNDLFLELSGRVTSTHTSIPYTSSSTDTWDVLKQAEEDPENNLNVLLIYGYNDSDGNSVTDRTRAKTETDTGGGDPGKWNREHVFAKSLTLPNLSTEEPGPGTDVHNLSPADSEQNANRSNRKFSDSSGNSGIVSSNGGWYPGDEWKGDVARAIMYMYLRYNGDGSKISETQCLPINVGFGNILSIDPNMVDLFLRWNVEDPVSSFEDQHNPVTEGTQGNRNPFIDNPYLATLIWGGLNAEDRWDLNSSTDTEAPSTPTNLIASNIKDDSVEVSWNASTDNTGVIDYLIYLNGTYLQTSLATTTILIGLSQNTGYEITIKARDAASNLSITSAVLNVTTLVGPIVLMEENFNDCSNISFFTYSEASDKDWACETQFGENSTGSMGINGYQENELSKDWLITTNPIEFDKSTGEKLSFYTDAAYGSTPLELVYSSDYDGSSNPNGFTWTSVPNITIPIHSNGSGTEEVFTFNDVDISSITGTAYMAFKYYSNASPTRWTVDSFEVTAVETTLAVDDFGIDKVITAYPNPSNGVFKIAMPIIQNEVTIEIYTIQSQLISRKLYTVNNGKVEINIDDKPTGLYIVQVHLENNSTAFKIVKQ
ncbi:MAG: T9SS type A sorting domain-containing protein, partial [Flavobacteriaceae bacterium]|nr:T9SS type A sorting domain-containing protein [Flavobacteriaceae bacterium]